MSVLHRDTAHRWQDLPLTLGFLTPFPDCGLTAGPKEGLRGGQSYNLSSLSPNDLLVAGCSGSMSVLYPNPHTLLEPV